MTIATMAFTEGWKKAQEWEVELEKRREIAIQILNGILAGRGRESRAFRSN